MTELQLAATQVAQADDYLAIFGGCSGDSEAIAAHIKQVYRHLVRVLYPDRYAAIGDKATAESAFQRLGRLHADALQALAEGRYGQPLRLVTIRTRRCTHEVMRAAGKGDLCDLYQTRTAVAAGGTQATLLKVARRPADKDLLQNEAVALKRLRGPDADPKWTPFVPELADSFVYHEAHKPRRQANVIVCLEGFYNLEQVRRAFPLGLDALHMVWVWRRLLVALGHAQDHRIVHGAVLPRHIMVKPEQHGVVLADWCYASIGRDGGQLAVKAIVDDYKDWYPAEVLAKQPPGVATDIAMAVRSMVWLMGGNPLNAHMPAGIPRPIRAFLRGCLQNSASARPDDAWRLLKEFDELLEEMGPPYYPRWFRPFTMPNGVV